MTGEHNTPESIIFDQQLEIVIESVPEALAFYDSNDKLIICNKAYRDWSPVDIRHIFQPGISFENVLRANIEQGQILEASDRKEEWISERLELRRSLPKGAFFLQRRDGRFMQAHEKRTPDGGTCHIITDVSLLERTKLELIQAKKDADEVRKDLKRDRKKLLRSDELLREGNDFLQRLINTVPVPIFAKDTEGSYLFINTVFRNSIAKGEDWVGKSVWDIAPPELARIYDEADRSLMNSGGEQEYEAKAIFSDGAAHDVIFYKAAFTDSNGNISGLIGVILDITERKKAEQDLLTQGKIISNMAEGALLIRASDATILYANPLSEKMFGYQSGEMLGMHMSSLHARTNLTAGSTHENIERELKVHGVWRGEVHNVKKDGTEFWSSVSVSALDHPEYGKVWVTVRTDITERKLLDAKVRYQANHDALTGLISRYEFEQRVTRLLSSLSKEHTAHAMCFLDLDQFKVINDTCGHAAGDELLRQIGRVLQETIRKRDTLARLGGDEFGVLMEHCTLEQAHRVADDILNAIMDYQFFWDDNAFRIGVSIGLVAITEASGNFTDIFKRADAACYLAKDLGRNRIHAYHPDDTELAVRHGEMQWVGRIHRALNEDRYCLYAQPIVPLDDSEHRHYEMLLRMIDETGKVVPPGTFLPAAERYNLIGILDRWVVENALTLLAQNPPFTDRIHFISINLSGQSLTSGDFLDFIREQIRNTGIEASKVCFEVTETLAISNLVAARTFINSLKDLGCHFALDDFGSGLSSFGYLKNLPVDYLKIDGMFVKDIVDDPIDHAMVKSINEIGQVMGMQTIAEFVENDEIKVMLGEIGVDYVQGYGVGKPLPFDEVVEQTYFRLS